MLSAVLCRRWVSTEVNVPWCPCMTVSSHIAAITNQNTPPDPKGLRMMPSARPPNLSSTGYDLWPSNLQRWPFHALAPWITCANLHQNSFIHPFRSLAMDGRTGMKNTYCLCQSVWPHAGKKQRSWTYVLVFTYFPWKQHYETTGK